MEDFQTSVRIKPKKVDNIIPTCIGLLKISSPSLVMVAQMVQNSILTFREIFIFS